MQSQPSPDESLNKELDALVIWAVFLVPLIISAVSFALAEQRGWTLGWLYIGVWAANLLVQTGLTLIWNPVLLARRAFMGSNTKRWDMVILALLTVCIVAIYFTFAEEGEGRGIADAVPGISWLIAAMVFALGMGLLTWCSLINPFLEKTVRIQSDHQHRVIHSGPYALVRHPFYVGFIGTLAATPVMLDSITSWIPAVACVLVLVIRTELEDRTLQTELDGYREYAERVRYRLVPGIF